MGVKLGNGKWAIKEDKLLAYNDNSGRFFNKEFDFSRGSSATYVAKDGLIKSTTGDTPRIDFSDTVKGALLLEPQSTNLVTYSEDFSQWTKQNVGTGSAPIITSNNAISPDGTQNADKVVFNKGTGTTTADLSILTTSFTSQSNTASIYIKADSPQRIVIRNSSTWVGYDIGTEWTRIEKTDTGGSIQIGLRDGYGIANVPNTATVYLWGAQVEARSYATSYIPTFGSTATRLADVCNNSGSAQDFSEEGVLYVEIAALANENSTTGISINDGTTSNAVQLFITNTINQIRARVSNSTAQFFEEFTLSDITNFNKIAIKYKQNDFALWVNGNEVATDTSGNTPSGLNNLSFDRGDGANDFNAKVRELQVFTEALTDEQLQKLTTI